VLGHYVLVDFHLGNRTQKSKKDDSCGQDAMTRGKVKNGFVEKVAQIQDEVSKNDPNDC
jgi:hypothetical protein